MALDTANKRGSTIGEFSFLEVLPFPDSSVDAGDRQQVAWTYRGILAGASVAIDYAGGIDAATRGFGLNAKARGFGLDAQDRGYGLNLGRRR
jgi:hypothetical protein